MPEFKAFFISMGVALLKKKGGLLMLVFKVIQLSFLYQAGVELTCPQFLS